MAAEDEQAAAVLTATADVLGTSLAGMVLYGSAVGGGVRRRSDLDLLAVLEHPMTPGQRRDLVARLVSLSRLGLRPATWRPVELTAVVRDEIVPWRYPPRHEFQYGEWLREDLESGGIAPAPMPNPDLAVLITTARASGRALLGPPPAELLDPVPAGDLRRAMVEGLDGLLADLDGDERNVILTLARMWTTIATGEIRSKDTAADWAIPRLPPEHRPVLERARAVYLDLEEEGWNDLRDRIGPFVDHVVAEIHRAAAET